MLECKTQHPEARGSRKTKIALHDDHVDYNTTVRLYHAGLLLTALNDCIRHRAKIQAQVNRVHSSITSTITNNTYGMPCPGSKTMWHRCGTRLQQLSCLEKKLLESSVHHCHKLVLCCGLFVRSCKHIRYWTTYARPPMPRLQNGYCAHRVSQSHHSLESGASQHICKIYMLWNTTLPHIIQYCSNKKQQLPPLFTSFEMKSTAIGQTESHTLYLYSVVARFHLHCADRHLTTTNDCLDVSPPPLALARPNRDKARVIIHKNRQMAP